MICAHANGECLRRDAHCGGCGYPSRNGTPHPECRERGRAQATRDVAEVLRQIGART